jgi:hypothetical protein
MGEEERESREREDRDGQAEAIGRMREEIASLPVAEHVAYMLHSLSALAVGRLGITAETAERRDLGQARLAIDAFKALLAVLEPVRPAAEVAAQRGMLSQLQLAFAGAMTQGGAASQVGEERLAPLPSEEDKDKEPPAADEVPAADHVRSAKQKPAPAGKAPAAKKRPAAADKTSPRAKKGGR